MESVGLQGSYTRLKVREEGWGRRGSVRGREEKGGILQKVRREVGQSGTLSHPVLLLSRLATH